MTTRAVTIWNGLEAARRRLVTVTTADSVPVIGIEPLREDRSSSTRFQNSNSAYSIKKMIPLGLIIDIMV